NALHPHVYVHGGVQLPVDSQAHALHSKTVPLRSFLLIGCSKNRAPFSPSRLPTSTASLKL
ncbi:MAG: hypothetical protein RAK20_06595, partial [Conexivisphaerales archaeon]|nr:hypothetical protein [Conexivisphaerales archaeon]